MAYFYKFLVIAVFRLKVLEFPIYIDKSPLSNPLSTNETGPPAHFLGQLLCWFYSRVYIIDVYQLGVYSKSDSTRHQYSSMCDIFQYKEL
jgi:hypothetical protein